MYNIPSIKTIICNQLGNVSFENVELIDVSASFEVQINYLEISHKRRAKKENINNYDEIINAINDNLEPEQYKLLLTDLAFIGNIKALNYLKEVVKDDKNEFYDWAGLALNECKMKLENELGGQRKIYIASPLGTEHGKMRFLIRFNTKKEEGFSISQQKIIFKEFTFQDERHKTETNISFNKNKCEGTILFPLDLPISQTINETINECNMLGCEIDSDNIIIETGKGNIDLEQNRKEIK
ncbi:MAG: hypothetical protein MJ211_06055 [Bacteroidales bacterium]|nr:hypothetical protein [Bacteroidales bacterium]